MSKSDSRLSRVAASNLIRNFCDYSQSQADAILTHLKGGRDADGDYWLMSTVAKRCKEIRKSQRERAPKKNPAKRFRNKAWLYDTRADGTYELVQPFGSVDVADREAKQLNASHKTRGRFFVTTIALKANVAKSTKKNPARRTPVPTRKVKKRAISARERVGEFVVKARTDRATLFYTRDGKFVANDARAMRFFTQALAKAEAQKILPRLPASVKWLTIGNVR